MKTMKTTPKKPSPLKFFTPIAGMDSVKKATDAVSAAYKAKKDAKAKAATTKTPEGKPSSKTAAPRGPLARAKAKAETSIKTKAPAAKPSTETSIKTTAPKPNPAGKPASKTETSVKAPTMQLKKAGMKKKC